MSRLYLIFFILVNSEWSFGQHLFNFTVSDSATHVGIPNVTIYLQQRNLYTAANSFGKAKVFAEGFEKIIITSVGFVQKTIVLNSISDTIYLQRASKQLQEIVISAKPPIIFKNAKNANSSWQIKENTHFFTRFIFPCSGKVRLRNFTVFQNQFDGDVKIQLAFYEDSLGLPGKRITDFYSSADTTIQRGRLKFNITDPIFFENKDSYFFEISGLNWPSENTFTGIRSSNAINFTSADKRSYTIPFFTGGQTFSNFIERNSELFRTKGKYESLFRNSNPLYELECDCLN